MEAFLSETDYNFEKLIVDGGVARWRVERNKIRILEIFSQEQLHPPDYRQPDRSARHQAQVGGDVGVGGGQPGRAGGGALGLQGDTGHHQGEGGDVHVSGGGQGSEAGGLQEVA